RADRILPILVVAAAPIEAQRSGSKRLGGDVLGLGEEVAAVDRDLPVASDELDAVHADRAAMDGHAVLITERDVLSSFARRLDLDGTLEIPPEPPLRDVEVMRPPIGHHAARELAEIAPRERVKAWMEGHLARGPEPEIPVEAGWSLLGGKVARTGGPPHVHPDALDLSDATISNQLASLQELARRALLASGLKDAAEASRRIDHATALLDREGERLLAVDVLSGLARMDRDERVPVIGHGDDDGVDVLAIEKRPVVLRLEARPFEARRRAIEKALVDVAQRDRWKRAIAKVSAEMPASHSADADEPDADPVVRIGCPTHAERAGPHDRGGRHRAESGGKKTSSRRTPIHARASPCSCGKRDPARR